jgi:hypothetical protein
MNVLSEYDSSRLKVPKNLGLRGVPGGVRRLALPAYLTLSFQHE